MFVKCLNGKSQIQMGRSGALDENGFANHEGFDSGTCQVTFPELDQDAWEKL